MAQIPFVGPFPPPVHGQAVATATIAEILERRGLRLRKLDTGERGGKRLLRSLVSRALGVFLAAFYCLLPSSKNAYISVNANTGMLVTGVLAGLARLGGKTMVLHHHTFSHIAEESSLMRFLIATAGRSAVHLTVCPNMSHQLKCIYPNVSNTATFSNLDSVDADLCLVERTRVEPSTLGLMGNLTTDKGVQRAIEAFRLAKAHGVARRLVLAGPCFEPNALAAIKDAGTEFGRDLIYLGPVQGQEKRRFFEEIDVFLFPSLYRNETQGIVNLEALAAGLPVVAYGQCCIPNDLNDPSCAVLDTEQAFDVGTVAFLEALRQRYPEACAGARARFLTLSLAHECEINLLVGALRNDAISFDQ